MPGQSAAQDTKPAHHTEDGFRNPHLKPLSKNPFTYWRMRLFGDEEFADYESNVHKIPVVDKVADLKKPAQSVHVTWLGHSSFLVQKEDINILTDPILSNRASPFSFAGPKRLPAKPISYDDLPKIDLVVISHNHYDHLDIETIRTLGDTPLYLVPLKLKQWFIDAGIAADRVREFDWWDKAQFGRVKVTATPSQHWSARGLFDRGKTLWAAWHFAIDDFSMWFAGDTGYNPIQFKEIGQKMGPVDLAMIPIGGYAPRWFMKRHHINPDEAIKIHNEIKSSLSLGMHWGTFQLTAEPIDQPKSLLDKAVKSGALNAGKFVTMAIGETRILTSQ